MQKETEREAEKKKREKLTEKGDNNNRATIAGAAIPASSAIIIFEY